MKILYSRVREILLGSSKVEISGNALKRINNLSGFITGMIRKGSSHLPDLGSGLRGDIYGDSKTVAAKRFLENKWTDFDTHYLPYLHSFLLGILTLTYFRDGITIVIDGSQMGKDNAALMISLVWKKRGIPICWYVKNGGKGHFKTADHLKVTQHAIEILRSLLPDNMPVTLLGDGEFDGIELQQLCLDIGWNYVLRTACDTVLYQGDECFHAKDITTDNNHDCVFLEMVEFTLKRFKYVSYVCWHDKTRHEEAIYLISNLLCAGEIIEFYDQRYSIECLFKDLKSTSFNLHKTRLKYHEQVSNLILIAALAFMLLTVIAIKYDSDFWRKKVQRVRTDCKVLSFYTFAYRFIDYLIDNDIGFNFYFQISKNEQDNFEIILN